MSNESLTLSPFVTAVAYEPPSPLYFLIQAYSFALDAFFPFPPTMENKNHIWLLENRYFVTIFLEHILMVLSYFHLMLL